MSSAKKQTWREELSDDQEWGKCKPDAGGKFAQRICEAEEEGWTDIKDKQFTLGPHCPLTRLTQHHEVSSA